MNMASTNILNLLLGVAPAQPGAVNGAVAPTQSGGQTPFDLLFGSLLGANTKGTEAVDTFINQIGAEKETSLPWASPLPAQFSTDLKALLTGRTTIPTTISEVTPMLFGNAPWTDTDGDADDTAPINSAVPFGKSAVPTVNPFAEIGINSGDTFDVRALMALMPTAPVSSMNSNLNSLPINLSEGDYQILDWSVNNGTLNLQLAPVDGGVDSSIRVSLPLAHLNLAPETAQLIDPNGWQRFDLSGTTDRSRQLLKTLEAVNLKELKIEIANPTAIKAAAELSRPMQLTLIGENVGQEVAIKANIARNQIRARVDLDPNALATKTDGAFKPLGAGETRTLIGAQAAIPGNPIDETADGRILANKTASGFDLFARSTTGALKTDTAAQTDLTALPDFAKSLTQATFDQNRDTAAPTRFIFPENARTMLKPNGQSVQLRLDPEHLGPARLSLTVHNDTLRASVVVDSQQAKQAVEGSLDRLVQALARADIKVEFINVTVDQHASREQLLDQRPQWTKSSRSGRLFELEHDSVPAATAAPAMYRTATGYVGAGGVNMLA